MRSSGSSADISSTRHHRDCRPESHPRYSPDSLGSRFADQGLEKKKLETRTVEKIGARSRAAGWIAIFTVCRAGDELRERTGM